MRYLILLSLFVLISCSQDNNPVTTEYVNREKSPLDSLILSDGIIKFYNHGKLNTEISSSGEYHSQFNISTGYSMLLSAGGVIALNSPTILINGELAKSVTEEYEDKYGNVHTKVYKNGLLVSLKINGVEQ